jgi:hypothetical protein
VDNALRLQPTLKSAGATISANASATSSLVITDEGANAANALSLSGTPSQGQVLRIANQDAQAVDFSGMTVPAGQTREYLYANGAWQPVRAQPGDDGDWQTGSGNAYRTSGNVGMGQADPQADLVVTDTRPVLALSSPWSSNGMRIEYNEVDQELRF